MARPYLPRPYRRAAFAGYAYCHLPAHLTREELVSQVAGFLHADQLVDGARLVAAFSGRGNIKIEKRENALEWCNSLLYGCLNSERYDLAAQLLWGETLFSYKPKFSKLVWQNIQTSSSLMLMGSASTSKSYSAGVWFLLDWVRDPEYTSVHLVGPSEDHLKSNLFTHLVSLHSSASLPLPGVIGDLFIGLNTRERKSAIRGVVIPIGKRPAGRLQGSKRVPRKTPHPVFGALSRIRFLLDEGEKIPEGVWKDVDNIFANLTDDVEGFKLVVAFNPENPNGPTALRCEPAKGWENFDAEADEVWESKRAWRVLRLDAAKCENVVQRKVIYPGLQTYEGFNRIISNAGGMDTPGYYTMARAMFPREGAIYTVLPATTVSRLKGEFMFGETPENCGGVDIALEGGDAIEFAVGRFGKAVGIRYPATLDNPNGREKLFTGPDGKRRMRWALQIDQVFNLKPGDTVKVATEIRDNAIKFNIPARLLMLDRTGNGAGVHDLLKSLWNAEVRGVNYSEGATERKILEEDSKTAEEEYERAVSELWFATKKWAEHEFIKVKPEAFSEELNQQLSGRRYASGKLSKVESKPEYKARGNKSPGKADAVTLLLHAVRVDTGCRPSALDDNAGNIISGNPEGNAVPQVVCVSNQYEDLEDESGW